jgi:hypothetical protein
MAAQQGSAPTSSSVLVKPPGLVNESIARRLATMMGTGPYRPLAIIQEALVLQSPPGFKGQQAPCVVAPDTAALQNWLSVPTSLMRTLCTHHGAWVLVTSAGGAAKSLAAVDLSRVSSKSNVRHVVAHILAHDSSSGTGSVCAVFSPLLAYNLGRAVYDAHTFIDLGKLNVLHTRLPRALPLGFPFPLAPFLGPTLLSTSEIPPLAVHVQVQPLSAYLSQLSTRPGQVTAPVAVAEAVILCKANQPVVTGLADLAGARSSSRTREDGRTQDPLPPFLLAGGEPGTPVQDALSNALYEYFNSEQRYVLARIWTCTLNFYRHVPRTPVPTQIYEPGRGCVAAPAAASFSL